MAWTNNLTELCYILADLYPTDDGAKRLLRFSGIQSIGIDFQGKSINIWDSILIEVDKQNRIQDLLSIILREYPEREDIRSLRQEIENERKALEQKLIEGEIDIEPLLKIRDIDKITISPIEWNRNNDEGLIEYEKFQFQLHFNLKSKKGYPVEELSVNKGKYNLYSGEKLIADGRIKDHEVKETKGILNIISIINIIDQGSFPGAPVRVKLNDYSPSVSFEDVRLEVDLDVFDADNNKVDVQDEFVMDDDVLNVFCNLS